MATWTIEQCPRCGGSGFLYHFDCNGFCEHDKPCPRCHLTGEIPVRAEGLDEIIARMATALSWYPTRRAAVAEIEATHL